MPSSIHTPHPLTPTATQQIRDFASTLHKHPVDTLACLSLATTLCVLALLPPDTHHHLLETLLPPAPPPGGDPQAILRSVVLCVQGRTT